MNTLLAPCATVLVPKFLIDRYCQLYYDVGRQINKFPHFVSSTIELNFSHIYSHYNIIAKQTVREIQITRA